MDYQQLVDLKKPEHVLIEYKMTPSNVSPAVSQAPNGKIACKTNSDCPTGYRCVQAGPIQYNPLTKKTVPHLSCWKNGSAIPL